MLADQEIPRLTLWQYVLVAREQYLGFYLATYLAYGFYFGLTIASHEDVNDQDISWSAYSFLSSNYFDIGAVSSLQRHRNLFYLTIILYFLSGLLWLALVWLVDPGIVDTRDQNFLEIMDLSIVAQGPPSSREHCLTTMVKKPVRSKYCRSSGFVVARMDHYCMWLNNSIGYGNHRIFMIFLYVHLIFAALAASLLMM
jgi:hypothetical protein